MSRRWAVIGAGNGGQAMAAYFAMHGIETAIYDIDGDTIARLNELGGVTLSGARTGFGRLALASTDIGAVVTGAEIVWVILPSPYHKSIAAQLAPHLADGQTVILNPVSALGTMEFRKALRDAGCTADITLAGACTLLFACRLSETGFVTISGVKEWLTVSAVPAAENARVKAMIGDVLPEYDFVEDIITVYLHNRNYAVHPGPTLLYTGLIENGHDFEYYCDMGRTQIKLVEAIDAEVVRLARAYGEESVLPLAPFFHKCYGVPLDSLHTMLTTADCYKGIAGPKSMDVRYLQEDVPYALKGIQSLARIAGVETPAIDAVVTLSYLLMGGTLDEGRTAASVGLPGGITAEELSRLCRG